VEQVAEATVAALLDCVPASVPGIVFLSGGQSDEAATAHLNAMNQLYPDAPWQLSFSYARALQGAPMEIWMGDASNKEAAQKAFTFRARLCSAARKGEYSPDMEKDAA
jgi:fructose-bisphosphate aldolase class I